MLLSEIVDSVPTYHYSFTGLVDLNSVPTYHYYSCTGLVDLNSVPTYHYHSFSGLVDLNSVPAYHYHSCTGLVDLNSVPTYHYHSCTGLVDLNSVPTYHYHSCTCLVNLNSVPMEIDYLFTSIVLPNLTYALSVYGSSESDLACVQRFLDRYHKWRFTSTPFSIYNILKKQDFQIHKKTTIYPEHPLSCIIPSRKCTNYSLRNSVYFYPRIFTERLKSTFVNRLIFKYNLV